MNFPNGNSGGTSRALCKDPGFDLLAALMAQESNCNGIRLFSLVSTDGRTRADIVPELGGIVSSLLLPGPDGKPRECLFRYPWFWDPRTPELRGGIPPLFPVCGRLLKNGVRGLYHVGARPFVLPIHGFSMRLPWEVVDAGRPDALRLRLADSEPTRAMYPFAFELELDYVATPEGLSCGLTVRNRGDEPMPHYAGFHPYFATPPPGAGKERTLFAAQPRARHLYNAAKTEVVGAAPIPVFPMRVADVDVNELLLEVAAPGVTRLIAPDGFEIRQTASDLFRYRQFYTLPDEPFFCDEPWMAPPGSLNRPGAARVLPPGQSESGTIWIASANG